jgi:hypothetical protein
MIAANAGTVVSACMLYVCTVHCATVQYRYFTGLQKRNCHRYLDPEVVKNVCWDLAPRSLSISHSVIKNATGHWHWTYRRLATTHIKYNVVIETPTKYPRVPTVIKKRHWPLALDLG